MPIESVGVPHMDKVLQQRLRAGSNKFRICLHFLLIVFSSILLSSCLVRKSASLPIYYEEDKSCTCKVKTPVLHAGKKSLYTLKEYAVCKRLTDDFANLPDSSRIDSIVWIKLKLTTLYTPATEEEPLKVEQQIRKYYYGNTRRSVRIVIRNPRL